MGVKGVEKSDDRSDSWSSGTDAAQTIHLTASHCAREHEQLRHYVNLYNDIVLFSQHTGLVYAVFFFFQETKY